MAYGSLFTFYGQMLGQLGKYHYFCSIFFGGPENKGVI